MFPPIIFKRLYLLYTGFFKEKKLHQINERFIIFPTGTIVLYKKRRKKRLFFCVVLFIQEKNTKCSGYSLIMYRQVISYFQTSKYEFYLQHVLALKLYIVLG